MVTNNVVQHNVDVPIPSLRRTIVKPNFVEALQINDDRFSTEFAVMFNNNNDTLKMKCQ